MNFIYIIIKNPLLNVNYQSEKRSNLKKKIYLNSNINRRDKNLSILHKNKKNYVDELKYRNFLNERNHYNRNNFSHHIIISLSTLGLLETCYLSVLKLNDSNVICATNTCSFVLNSVFSEFMNIPIIYFGFLFYLTVFFLNFVIVNITNGSSKGYHLNIFLYLVYIFSSSIGLFFIFILENILEKSCQWCLLSILLSGFIFVFQNIILSGRSVVNPKIFLNLFIFTGLVLIGSYWLNLIEISFLLN